MTALPRTRRLLVCLMIPGIAIIGVGCAGDPGNPSFALTQSDARAALKAMAREPVAPVRPMVVVGGFGDPGVAAGHVGKRLTAVLQEPRFFKISSRAETFDAAADELVAGVDEAFGPGPDEDATIAVDVVGNSMGGLVAAYAAESRPGARRLRIVRLFTIGTPFGGAQMAKISLATAQMQDMRPGSDFLAPWRDPDRTLDYELVPYVREGDTWVGAHRTAPAGMTPWWVPDAPFEFAHLMAYKDPRILADIARRLRGEAPYTQPPSAPLPPRRDR